MGRTGTLTTSTIHAAATKVVAKSSATMISMNAPRVTSLSIAAAIPLLVASCSVGASSSDGGPTASDGATASTESVTEGTIPLGGTFTSSDEITLGISKPTSFKPSQYAYVKGQSAFAVIFKLTNGSTEPYEPTDTYATASAGGVECERGFDSQLGVDADPATAVLPGHSVSWKVGWGCDAATGSELLIEAEIHQLSPDSQRALFSGQLP